MGDKRKFRLRSKKGKQAEAEAPAAPPDGAERLLATFKSTLECSATLVEQRRSAVAERISLVYKAAIDKVIELADTSDNNAIAELDAGELTMERTNTLMKMTRMHSTRELAAFWAIAMILIVPKKI